MSDITLSVMDWETSLLGRKIGRVEGLDRTCDMRQGVEALADVERRARASGFTLLVSRVSVDHFTPLWSLEASGYLAVDVGVTFAYDLKKNVSRHAGPPPQDVFMREATVDDIPQLRELVKGLFLNSYYYVTPFLPRIEADLLYGTWVANCVRKERADKVLLAATADGVVGFITCRSLGDQAGVIDLVGVDRNHGSCGIGKLLVQAALDCFREMDVSTVHVRTQVTNIPAVNVYLATGARLLKVDATLIKALTVPAARDAGRDPSTRVPDYPAAHRALGVGEVRRAG